MIGDVDLDGAVREGLAGGARERFGGREVHAPDERDDGERADRRVEPARDTLRLDGLAAPEEHTEEETK